jgi:hypothetical protein
VGGTGVKVLVGVKVAVGLVVPETTPTKLVMLEAVKE